MPAAALKYGLPQVSHGRIMSFRYFKIKFLFLLYAPRKSPPSDTALKGYHFLYGLGVATAAISPVREFGTVVLYCCAESRQRHKEEK